MQSSHCIFFKNPFYVQLVIVALDGHRKYFATVRGLTRVYLLKRFKYTDYVVALVGLLTFISRLVITSHAANTWMY